MKIGFVGYGSMAAALAGKWAPRHELFFGGRDPAKAQAAAAAVGPPGPGARAGSSADAAGFGEVVVLALRHDATPAAMPELAPLLAGRVVIDINNPVDVGDPAFLPEHDGVFSPSFGEWLAAAAPGARIVKAFNLCQASVWAMPEPVFDGRRLVTPICGDDAEAKAAVAGLVEEVGCDAVDIGGLNRCATLEHMASLVIQLLFSGRDHKTVLNLIQPEVKPIA